LQLISAGEAPQSTTALMAQVFSDPRENRPKAGKSNDTESFLAAMAIQINAQHGI